MKRVFLLLFFAALVAGCGSSKKATSTTPVVHVLPNATTAASIVNFFMIVI